VEDVVIDLEGFILGGYCKDGIELSILGRLILCDFS
jgi:hypothetical protein